MISEGLKRNSTLTTLSLFGDRKKKKKIDDENGMLNEINW